MKVDELIYEIRNIINLPPMYKDPEYIELFKNSKELSYSGHFTDYKKRILELLDKFEEGNK